jgi:hypothetical protein
MCIRIQLENLNNTKRLGRYNSRLSNNNNIFIENNTSNSLPYFRELAQYVQLPKIYENCVQSYVTTPGASVTS